MDTPHIIVVGGGYAGLMAAIRLSGRLRRGRAKISLVSPRPHFVERIRLQEVSVGLPSATFDIAEMLTGMGVEFLQGEVTSIDPNNRTLCISTALGGELMRYDQLVLAAGSHIDLEALPGLAECAFWPEWDGPRGARALSEKLEHRKNDALRIGVLGGGPSGVELAGMIKAKYSSFDVHLISNNRIGNFKTTKVEGIMRDELTALGVVLHDHCSATAITQNAIKLETCGDFKCDMTIWCGGLIAPGLAEKNGFSVNERGQALTDSYLRTLLYADIFAVGDCAAPVGDVGAPLRMSVFTAVVMGAHCADNQARQVKGSAMRPFSFSYYGQGIALGGRNAVGFATIPDDKPVGPIYRHATAFHIRNFFVWYLLAALKLEKRLTGSFYWLGRRRVREPYSAHEPQSSRDRTTPDARAD